MNIDDDLSEIYASPMDTGTYRLLGLDRHAPQAVNNHGRYGGLVSADGQFDGAYKPCAEAATDEPNRRMMIGMSSGGICALS